MPQHPDQQSDLLLSVHLAESDDTVAGSALATVSEFFYVFGTLDATEAACVTGSDSPASFSEYMMTAWGAFMRSDRPGSDAA